MSDRRVVVVTGAGGGLGKEVALRLGADGEIVVLLGRTFSKVRKVADDIGSSALALECDVADPGSVRSAFATIEERLGQIDVLINNAAIFEPCLIEKTEDESLKNTFAINLLGPALCARSAIPLMRRQGRSLMINVTSESVDLDMPLFSAYEASKAGLERLSRGLRHELRKDGIRVTVLRVGTMTHPENAWTELPPAFQRLFEAGFEAGFDFVNRPSSPVSSVAHLIRNLIDLPADMSTDLVTLSSYKT